MAGETALDSVFGAGGADGTSERGRNRALKREISVERLAEARGVELKRHGKDLLGLCPFHDDTSRAW